MGKYIKIPNISFSSDNLGQVTLKNTINDIGLGKTIVIPNISFASNNLGKVHILNEHYFEYFTIESLVDNNRIGINRTGNSPGNRNLSYSLDGGQTWTDLTLSENTSFSTINTGDKIMFKGVNDNLATAWNRYWAFISTKNIKVYGNIMSLLCGDNFITHPEFKTGSTHNLCGLFYKSTNLIDASDLVLPALTLMESCYNGMFRECSNLVNGPKLLPALDVPKDGYSSMFESCIKLVEGPEIDAITVSGTGAMMRMFCMARSSKVTAAMTKSPILRVKNPNEYANGYQQIFCGNGNITEVTILAEGTDFEFANWLSYNSDSGVIKKLSTTTLVSGSNGVPSGWTTQNIDI